MTDCIEYSGKSSVGEMGYPTVQINKKRYYVHRIVSMLFHELEIQDTKSVVLHTCDNPRCINPAHLKVGTQRDNIHDCMAKGRFVKNKGLKGEKNPKAKLTWEQVRHIRELSKEYPNMTYAHIARNYGVSASMISGICRGFFWKE